MTPEFTSLEREALALLEASRPQALRAYDQIAMRGLDLLRAVQAAAPRLAGRDVAFVGDHDGTSLLLGLLAARGLVRPPRRMTLLDFDDRLLVNARALAEEQGFVHLLDTRLYNVFDPVPADLLGHFDAYYTNPPYGASNDGASVRLFMTRGSELASRFGAVGHVILPDDDQRDWTRRALASTRCFLEQHGWRVLNLTRDVHTYHLDDDPTLTSALLDIERVYPDAPVMPWAALRIDQSEIPYFYGRSVRPPLST